MGKQNLETRPFQKTGFLWVATAILILAALLRLAWLDAVPPGLSQDEVLNADIVRFIWDGQHALFFREGFGHEPLYHYLSAPFQRLWGDNLLSIRVPASYIGLLLIAAAMRWIARDFNRRTALFAGLWLAVSWWPIVFSRVGLRPGLAALWLVGMAWFWPRYISPPGRSAYIRPVLAGFFLALSIYTYTPAQVMLVLPLLYALYMLIFSRFQERRAESARSWWRPAGPPLLLFLAAVLLALPLFIILWADPTLLQRFDQVAGPLEALRAGRLQPLLENTFLTLGVFGWTGDPRPTYTLPGRPLFGWPGFLLFAGGLLFALWQCRKNARFGFVLLWLGVGLLPSILTAEAPSTIRLIIALPVVYLLPALALDALFNRPERQEETAWLGRPVAVLAFSLLIFVAVLGRTIQDGFLRWPAEVETRLRYQTVFRDMAAHWQAHPAGTPVFADAFYEPIDHDSLRRHLGVEDLDARWVQNGTAIVYPAGGPSRLYIPEYVTLDPLVVEPAGIAGKPEFRSTDSPAFALYPLPDGAQINPLPRPEPLGNLLTLQGYARLPVDNNGDLPLLTYWSVQNSLPLDLAIFVHLLDANGEIVAQFDGLDAARLQAGDHFLQLHRLPMPDPLPAGPFTLQIGVYSRQTGERLLRPAPPPGEPADRSLLEQGFQL